MSVYLNIVMYLLYITITVCVTLQVLDLITFLLSLMLHLLLQQGNVIPLSFVLSSVPIRSIKSTGIHFFYSVEKEPVSQCKRMVRKDLE